MFVLLLLHQVRLSLLLVRLMAAGFKESNKDVELDSISPGLMLTDVCFVRMDRCLMRSHYNPSTHVLLLSVTQVRLLSSVMVFSSAD